MTLLVPWTGNGPPPPGLGADGDAYTSSAGLFYRRVAGTWTIFTGTTGGTPAGTPTGNIDGGGPASVPAPTPVDGGGA